MPPFLCFYQVPASAGISRKNGNRQKCNQSGFRCIQEHSQPNQYQDKTGETFFRNEKSPRRELPQFVRTVQKQPYVGNILFKRSGVALAAPLPFLFECVHCCKSRCSHQSFAVLQKGIAAYAGKCTLFLG